MFTGIIKEMGVVKAKGEGVPPDITIDRNYLRKRDLL
jgi:riboflavin synthase alpha subunit